MANTALTYRTAYDATADLTLPLPSGDLRIYSAGVELAQTQFGIGFKVLTEDVNGVIARFHVKADQVIILIRALDNGKRIEASSHQRISLLALGLVEQQTYYLSDRGEVVAAALKAVIA